MSGVYDGRRRTWPEAVIVAGLVGMIIGPILGVGAAVWCWSAGNGWGVAGSLLAAILVPRLLISGGLMRQARIADAPSDLAAIGLPVDGAEVDEDADAPDGVEPAHRGAHRAPGEPTPLLSRVRPRVGRAA